MEMIARTSLLSPFVTFRLSLQQPKTGVLLTLLILFFCSGFRAVPAQLALTPPMGWNSWNHFGSKVSDADIRAAADALVATGMRDSGYIYVNIDDGWQGKRTESGELTGNERFPDMKALADYVHLRGLKLGIYSSPGSITCAGNEGSMGHEEQDARTFAKWGVDYLKYDICSYRKDVDREAKGDPALARQMMFSAFEKMHSALQSTGRNIVYSISQHGLSSGWTWSNKAGANLWRTGDDVRDNYLSVTDIGFAQGGLSKFAGPGHWNDPDMLEIGNGGLKLDEGRTQLSLWSLLAAPLLAGNDLSKMDSDSLAILNNREVLAIDQDPLGRQGDRLWTEGPIEIWARNLTGGSIAVGLFNRNQGPVDIPLNLGLLGLKEVVGLRDVWNHTDLPPIKGFRTFQVPPHGVVLLLLHP
jgi:alpha-galactosidase